MEVSETFLSFPLLSNWLPLLSVDAGGAPASPVNERKLKLYADKLEFSE